MNTGEIQGAPGSAFLARKPHSKKRSEWHYNLRQFTRSQRQGGHGRHDPRGGGTRPPRSRRCEGSLEAQTGGPSGGIRRGPRVPSRPLRISGRTRRGFWAQSRPKYWAISVGRWRSFRARMMPCWAPQTSLRRASAPVERVCTRNCRSPTASVL